MKFGAEITQEQDRPLFTAVGLPRPPAGTRIVGAVASLVVGRFDCSLDPLFHPRALHTTLWMHYRADLCTQLPQAPIPFVPQYGVLTAPIVGKAPLSVVCPYTFLVSRLSTACSGS